MDYYKKGFGWSVHWEFKWGGVPDYPTTCIESTEQNFNWRNISFCTGTIISNSSSLELSMYWSAKALLVVIHLRLCYWQPLFIYYFSYKKGSWTLKHYISLMPKIFKIAPIFWDWQEHLLQKKFKVSTGGVPDYPTTCIESTEQNFNWRNISFCTGTIISTCRISDKWG
jgi:hypothetical protein